MTPASIPSGRKGPSAVRPVPVLAEARALVASGTRDRAGALLRAHLLRNSRDAEARRMLSSLGPDARPPLRLTPDQRTALKQMHKSFAAADWARVLATGGPLLKAQPLLGEAANAVGVALKALGRENDALKAFDHGIRHDPALPNSYVNMSVLLTESGQPDAGEEAARAALDAAPDGAGGHFALGRALMALDRTEEGLDHLRTATKAEPADAAAHAELCVALERLGRLDALDSALAAADDAGTDSPALALLRGMAQVRRGAMADALTTLDTIDEARLDPRSRAQLAATRGRALDVLNRPDEAFAAFTRMNEVQARLRKLTGTPPYLDMLAARLAAPAPGPWPAAAEDDDGWTPAFLLGFPRSGTTLADAFLRGHPQVAITEEQGFSLILRRDIPPHAEAEALDALDAQARATRRAAYRTAFETQIGGPLGHRTAIDRMPLDLIEAAVIARHFPNARHIFVQRHPCDVVLSAFMQNFGANPATNSFLTLESTAIAYDRAMTLWHDAADRLALSRVTLRYETLIADPREALGPVLDLLGLDWHEAMTDHRQNLRTHVRTASYRQVGAALNRNAEGRWHRYADRLEPVMPLLTPWIHRLGYDAPAPAPEHL